VGSIPDILARIVDRKRQDLAALNDSRPLLERAAAQRPPARDFSAALRRSPAIIAECKKASPSKGVLNRSYEPASLAQEYETGGAAAVSVLTDEPFFQGSLAHLTAVRSAVSIPIIRKDFTIDPLHVTEAAANGADAVLLIAAILSGSELRSFRELAESYGMAALVEVHDDRELEAALASGARIVGVNNRDLRTFEVRLETSLRLVEKIPASVIRVAESGISSRADIELLSNAGFQAFLVGEHLMRSGQPAAAVRDLLTPVEVRP
jgi:indole-3-glycerol phosphate synthase